MQHGLSDATSRKCLDYLISQQQIPPLDAHDTRPASEIMSALLDNRTLDSQHVVITLSRLFTLRRERVSDTDVDTSLLRLVPHDIIHSARLLPLKISGPVAECGIVDPAARQYASEVRKWVGRPIEFILISSENFNTLVSSTRLSGMLHNTTAQTLAPQAKQAGNEDGDVPRFIDQIISSAIDNGASDIHIERFRHQARLRFRIDGELVARTEAERVLNAQYDSVITRLKILSGCDIAERRLPQDGAMTVTIDGEEIDIRVSFIPAKYANRAVLRILKYQAALGLDKLGFTQQEHARLVRAISSPQGMVLVTGPTGSGKTTTLYACLQHINHPARNIMTAEDPVEYYLEGVSQCEINDRIGLSFEAILRSFLRQDPEVILLGEIRDKQTADMAVKASLTGHLLLSSLHTNDAISSLTRLADMGVPRYLICSSLRLIIAQRLVRINCASCTETDTIISLDDLRATGLEFHPDVSVVLKSGTGCEGCGHTGYQGRQGIYEIIEMTDTLQTALYEGHPDTYLLKLAQKDGFVPMKQTAATLLQSGYLSAAEYLRVLAS